MKRNPTLEVSNLTRLGYQPWPTRRTHPYEHKILTIEGTRSNVTKYADGEAYADALETLTKGAKA